MKSRLARNLFFTGVVIMVAGFTTGIAMGILYPPYGMFDVPTAFGWWFDSFVLGMLFILFAKIKDGKNNEEND